MTSLPSSTYLLLTSPAVWVEKPMEGDVLKGLALGGWTWDPNETPPGLEPLPLAILKALDAMEFKRDQAAQGGLAYRRDINRKLSAFQRVLGGVLESGGRLSRSVLPNLCAEPHVQRWVGEVTWQDGQHAGDLRRGRELAWNMTAQSIQALPPGAMLQQSLAGLPLWAHIARQAVEDPCSFFCNTGIPRGLVERQSSGEECEENSRLVLALHAHAATSDDPVALAWWALIASPFRRYSRPSMERTLSSSQRALNAAWENVQEQPALGDLLFRVLAAVSSSALSSPLSTAVLMALPDLGRWLTREQVWTLASRSLAQMRSFQNPASSPCFWKGSRSSYLPDHPGIPTHDCQERVSVRRAAYLVVAQFGWPTLKWAEKAAIAPDALGFLLTAMAHPPSEMRDGLVRAWPAVEEIVAWGVWARTHQAPWPTAEQVCEWDIQTKGGTHAYAEAEPWGRLDASICLEAELKPAEKNRSRHRL